jgi:mitochondrial chaperone BCS1
MEKTFVSNSKWEMLPSDVVEILSQGEWSVLDVLSDQNQLYKALKQYIVEVTESDIQRAFITVSMKNHLTLLDMLQLQREEEAAQEEELKAQLEEAAKGEAVQVKKEKKSKISKSSSSVEIGFGWYRFRHEDHTIYALHHVVGNVQSSSEYGLQVLKHICLITEGSGNQSFLKSFCDEALVATDLSSSTGDVTVYRFDVQRQSWRPSNKKMRRPLHSVILPEQMKKKLVGDVSKFLSSKTLEFYVNHGIPYKRSYMFYGKPGTGKTSMISAIAGAFGRNICFMQASHPGLTDDGLKLAIQNAPRKSIIVFEDIDALFDKERHLKNDKSPLTFSGLLNSLDGVGDPDGQIFVLTTNHIEKLDPALIRHGRVDVILEFPTANEDQTKAMFLSFYPEEEKLAEEFAEAVKKKAKDTKGGISMAAVQHFFIGQMRSTAHEALANIDQLEPDPNFSLEESSDATQSTGKNGVDAELVAK